MFDAVAFLHGVEIQEVDSGPRPIGGVKASVIGLVGTASSGEVTLADGAVAGDPVLVSGSRKTAEASFGEAGTETTVADDNTLPYALNAVFDQTGAQVVVVKVADATVASVQAGVEALLGAESVVHQTPRILIAPGFSHEPSVVTTLNNTAERLRGVAIVDAPSTVATNADAITHGNGLTASSRVYLVHPYVKVSLGGEVVRLEPASARVAGVIAKSDDDRGFWWSPSNRQMGGIVGTARAIDFALDDVLSSANQLNEGKVATVIHQDGYRLWGNRSLSADPKWVFLSVRRTADLINDALQRAHLWAVDRNITKTYVDEVTEGVNAYLRYLKGQGAIINGACWADAELNTWDQIQQGKVTFDFDFTPPYPAEHITFRSTLVNDYLEEIFA